MSHHDQNHPGFTGRRSVALVQAAAHPPDETERAAWRSVEERAGAPAFEGERRYEFPAGSDTLDAVSRRDFVRLLGTTAVLTGTAACHRPNQKIVPYVRRPPESNPGVPLHFATAYGCDGFATGLVVESHVGRPTKIEGNPDHPDSLGATTTIEQALPLQLYDEDRAKQLTSRGQPLAWKTLLGQIAARSEKLAADGGGKLRFLVEPTTSPLLGDLRARILQKYPRARFVSFSSMAADAAVEGARLAFGRPLEVRHDLRGANVLVALDSDFLTDGAESTRLHREFSARRVPGGNLNRLYVAEPCPTPTGTMADHRLRVRGSEVVAVAQAILAELSRLPGMEALGGLAGLPRAQAQARVDAKWAAAVARDLHAHRTRGAVIAGRRQPAAVHALVHAMNLALGNIGATISLRAPLHTDATSGFAALQTLVTDIAAGQVDTLVITGGNPVYGAPVDFKLDKLLARVPEVIYHTLYEDETAAVAGTVVPAAHFLESWGDLRATDGTVSLVQPLIAPLWSGVTEADILAAFLGEGDHGTHRLLRTYWQRQAGQGAAAAAFEGTWERWLGRGVVDNSAVNAVTDAVLSGDLTGVVGQLLAKVAQGGGIEIAFAVDSKVRDGRYANNPWLQELPDPITKITWDNAILISQTTAQARGLKTSDVVRLEVGDRQVSGPVYVQPGHADDAVTVAIGYGRKGVGERLARGVGFNAGALRTSDAPWFARGAELNRTARNHRFGITQDHWSMEERDPALVATVKEMGDQHSKYNDHLTLRRMDLPTLQKPVDYSTQAYKWGMSIDLSKCSGCSACVIACASENNTPVVGRDNVRIGREMFWIRVDRYYTGSVEEPQAVTQPMMCVHCETAPCEYVCPVNATVHSDEGLNEMVYNRCIGTRYCSNNCPYKVRRFNFLDYHDNVTATGKMAANPDVTVRSRGIMEKCTYCVQRIERHRIDARIADRPIRDGALQTACQQVCPADAIVFGSLNDPQARVTKQHQDDRRYNVLHELGTRPRTAYLARIRNPNPELV